MVGSVLVLHKLFYFVFVWGSIATLQNRGGCFVGPFLTLYAHMNASMNLDAGGNVRPEMTGRIMPVRLDTHGGMAMGGGYGPYMGGSDSQVVRENSMVHPMEVEGREFLRIHSEVCSSTGARVVPIIPTRKAASMACLQLEGDAVVTSIPPPGVEVRYEVWGNFTSSMQQGIWGVSRRYGPVSAQTMVDFYGMGMFQFPGGPGDTSRVRGYNVFSDGE